MVSEESFKDRLKQRRKARDLTQAELAHQVGCSIYTLQHIEEGTARPSRQLAELLAAALEIPAEERAAFVQQARALGPRSDAATAPTGSMAVSGNGPPSAPAAPDGANPYKGLRAFQEADAPDFFGREALTARLRERLGEETELARFLAVVGPSGAGKSSVVRAGLLPALQQAGLPGGGRPVVVDLSPGTHPLEELEAALLRVAVRQSSGPGPSSLIEQLQADERGLARAVKRVLPGDDGSEMLLLIDQFEELFTLVHDERVRARFIDSLFSAVADGRSRLRVVITLRADFYDRPLLYLPSSELFGRRSEVVSPLAADEMYRAITGPAERYGVALEDGLAAAIIGDVAEQPGMLPLLEYALTELYERREGRRMTRAAYQASGGVAVALARRAESLYEGLSAVEQSETRQLFLRLVTPGEGVEDTRRRVLIAELVSAARDPAALRRVLDRYGRFRMLTFDRDPMSGGPTVEVAHEALLRAWSRLRAWLAANREQLLVQRRLLYSAAEWQRSGQEPSYLARGARLAQFKALPAEEDGEGAGLALTAAEQAYLAASQAETERQEAAERERQEKALALARASASAQRSAANRLRVLFAGAVAFLIVALILSFFALDRGQAAQSSAATAVAHQTETDAQRATAVANGAEAQRQQGLAQAAAATAQADFTHADALRLAAEAKNLLQSGGPSELAGLLSLRSMELEYTAEGDAALEGATQLDYPVRRFVGHAADHDPIIVLVALSPDGKTLYTQSNSSTRLWDFATGRQLANIDFGGDSVSWAPDSKHLLATHADGTMYIWDTTAMTYTQSPITHTAALWGAVYSPDGRYILSSSTSSTDMTTQVWDAATGRQVQVFHGPAPFLPRAGWSPDVRYVATGARDSIARLWDVQTGLLVRTFQTGLTPYFGPGLGQMTFSPDGKTLAGAAIDTIWLWDVATGVELRELRGGTNLGLHFAFLPDGKTLLSSDWDTTVRLWDVATGQQLRVLHGPNSSAQALALTRDGRQAVVGYADGTVLIWDLGGPVYPLMPAGASVHTVTFSTDDRLVLTGSGRSARLFDAASGRQLPPVFSGPAGSSVNSAAFAPDGKFLLTGDGRPDYQAHIWDMRTATVVLTLPVHYILDDAIYSPDGKIVATTGDSATADLAGNYGQDGPVRLWDAASGRLLRAIMAPPSDVANIAFAPEGKTLATANVAHTASLWDVTSGQELRRFTGHTDIVAGVAFSPDGRWLATASADKTARLWNVATGKELRRFVGHTDGINRIAFSPDGKWLATASNDKTARLWDVTTGQEIRRFSGHTDAVLSVAFAHDGKLLLTGSQDGIARIWRTDDHDTMRYLCGALTRDLTPDERTQYGITDPGLTCSAH